MGHRQDAYQAGAYLNDQLQHLIPGLLRKQYAEIPFDRLCPVTSEVDPGARTFKYDLWDVTGEFDLITDYSADLPTAGVKRGEIINDVYLFGGAFEYTQDEILAAAKTNTNLEQEKANAVKLAYRQRANTTCLFGRLGTTLRGMFNHPAVDTVTVTGSADDGWFDSPDITPQQMLDLLNFGVTAVQQGSNQVESVNSLAMPYTDWRTASTTCRSETDSITVLDLFLKQNPSITSVMAINELDPAKSQGYLTAKQMVFYNKSPEKIHFHETLPLTMLPPQARNLAFKVPGMAKFGGFVPKYPKSMIYIRKG